MPAWLLIDPDPHFARATLGRLGPDAVHARSYADAADAIARRTPDLLLATIDPPASLDFLTEFRRENPTTVVITTAGFVDNPRLADASRLGVLECLVKPMSPERLTSAIERASTYRRLIVGDDDPGEARPLPASPAVPLTLERAVRQAERSAILDAILRHEGNRSRAAADLGIDRTTLFRKLQR